MCGRYALYGPVSRLSDRFGLAECADFAPRYNIAPQSDILVIRQHPEKGRVGVLHTWGLIPSWAKDPAIGGKLNNARAETVDEKPAFRSAFKRLRCLIPASGFYEWQAAPEGIKARKQPFYISPTTDEYFAFAGLVECWQPEEGSRVLSVCVITTTPNEVMVPIHDRMSVILPDSLHDTWLDVRNHDTEALMAILRPTEAAATQAWPVSIAVSQARNDGEELITRLVCSDLSS